MERMLLKRVGDYRLTATAYGADETAAPISAPVAAAVYDSDDELVYSGTPTVTTEGLLTLAVPNATFAAGVYYVVWSGTVDAVAQEWETYLELYESTAPDYETYQASGGSLTETEFDALLPAAQAAVDEAIWPNGLTTATRAAYERAICAVIDAMATSGGAVERGGVLSETVGRTSVTYAAPNVLAAAGLTASPVAAAIRRHLSSTGLLYRGI